jgi:hypothetical protein
MQRELEAFTSTVPNPNYDPNLPEGPGNESVLIGEFSCERIQVIVQEYVQEVTDIIISKTESISNIMAEWAPILSVPGNPLKIIPWAIKVALGPAGAAVEQTIKQIQEIIQLVVAIAELAGAVANAIATLASCIQNVVQDALNAVIDTVLQQAANLMQQAENMAMAVVDQVMQDSGLQDILNTVNDVEAQIDGVKAAGEEALNDVMQAAVNVKAAADTAGNISIDLATNNLELPPPQTAEDYFNAGPADLPPKGEGA